MNHKKLVLLIIPFLLVRFVSAARIGLDDYPDMFILGSEFQGEFVVADNAQASDVVGISDIAMSLRYKSIVSSTGTTIRNINIGPTRLASEITDPNAQNLILVGMLKRDASYGNPLIDEFYSGSPSGGLIKFIQNDDNYVLIVTGDSPDNVKKATEVLANYQDYDFYGTEINVDSVEIKQTELSPYDVKDTLMEEETKTYTINNIEYELTLRYIRDPYVSLRVNGEVTNGVKVGDIYKISDGSKIQVTKLNTGSVEFLFKSKEEQTQEEDIDEEVEDEKETKDHLLVVDDKSPVTDVVAISDLGMYLASLSYTNIAPAKLNSEVTRSMLDNSVTTFIYLGEAVIIVGKNSPSAHNKLARIIEEFLEDEKDIKVKTISSSKVKSNDLRDLFPNAVKEEETEEEEPEVEILPPPIEKDECASDSDCNDNNACTSDSCSGTPKKCSNTETAIGCNYNKKCIPIGIRVFDEYCDIDQEVYVQKDKEESCKNNYECSSNLCINDRCVSPSLIQRIMNFFKGLVGNAIRIVY